MSIVKVPNNETQLCSNKLAFISGLSLSGNYSNHLIPQVVVCYINYMANINKDNLNEIFHALADSTRREIVNTESLSQATEWLHFYEKFCSNRFDLLENELLKAKKKEH